jgi:outer membrane autotransporter protein
MKSLATQPKSSAGGKKNGLKNALLRRAIPAAIAGAGLLGFSHTALATGSPISGDLGFVGSYGAFQSIQNNTYTSLSVYSQIDNIFSGTVEMPTQASLAPGRNPALSSLGLTPNSQEQTTYMDDMNATGEQPDMPEQESQWSNLSFFAAGEFTASTLPRYSNVSAHYTTGGTLLGVGYKVTDNFIIGSLFNWSYSGGASNVTGPSEQLESYSPGLFAGYQNGGLYADGIFQYTYNDSRDNVSTPAAGLIVSANPSSNEYDLNSLVGYNFPICTSFKAGPAAGLNYTEDEFNSFLAMSPSGPSSFGGGSVSSLRSLLGAQAEYDWQNQSFPMPLTFTANAFWQHEYLTPMRSVNNAAILVSGSPRDSALIGGGVSGQLNQNVGLFVNYESQIGDKDVFGQSVIAGVSVGF